MEGATGSRRLIPLIHDPPSTLTILTSRPHLLLQHPPTTMPQMATRTAEEADLSDSAPDPVRLKANVPDEDTEMDTIQNQEAEVVLDGLTYVKTPIINPLDVHSWDDLTTLENLNQVQRTMWTNIQGRKVLAYRAYGGKISEPEEVAQLRDEIKRSLGADVQPTVSPPTPDFDRNKREASPPFCTLISDIMLEKAQALIAQVSPEGKGVHGS